MSSSQQTTNYQLPIFVAADKPSWLNDWNNAMRKLDAAIKTASEPGSGESATAQQALATANSALAAANSAETAAAKASSDVTQMQKSITDIRSDNTAQDAVISQLQSQMSTVQSDVSTNKQNIISATTLATTAKNTADSATTTANTAKSTADSASTKATSAQTTANTAKTTADSAQTQANTNKTAISNLQTRVTNLENSSGGGSSGTSIMTAICMVGKPIAPFTNQRRATCTVEYVYVGTYDSNNGSDGYKVSFNVAGVSQGTNGQIDFQFDKGAHEMPFPMPAFAQKTFRTAALTEEGWTSCTATIAMGGNYVSVILNVPGNSGRNLQIYGFDDIVFVGNGNEVT